MSQVACPNCGVSNRLAARFCIKCGARLASPGWSPPAFHTLRSGQLLQGRYRIECELGRGGFGAVYQAWDSNLNRWCAVKENRDTSSEAQRQFLREATVLSNLSHPNLPRVIDHFFIPAQGQYLVMDFIDGDDLAKLANSQGILHLDRCLNWIIQVAEGLEYLHALDPPVIHRDIKPSNIRITPKGQAVLVDFGLVKVSNPAGHATVGARAITPGYAPPEQYGLGTTDVRTDIYALAATLYRLLSGQEPPESIQRISGKALPALARWNLAVPPSLCSLIEKGMAIDPRQRFQNMAEFKVALIRIQGRSGAGVLAAGIPPTIVVEPAQLSLVQPAGRALPTPYSSPRKRWVDQLVIFGGGAIVAALFLIAIASFFVWMLVSNARSSQSTQQARLSSTAVSQVQMTASENSRLISETARVSTTQTAVAKAAATARVQATMTARAQAIATVGVQATSNARATEDFISGLLSQRKTESGPKSGRLLHNANDDRIVVEWIKLDLPDIVVEAEFFNPYAGSEGFWSYGFVFDLVNKDQYRLVIDSKSSWELIQTSQGGASLENHLVWDTYSDILTGDSDSNQIRFLKQDRRVWLFINDQLITEFDLSAWVNINNIGIATGIWTDSEITGKTTSYENFTIWSLP